MITIVKVLLKREDKMATYTDELGGGKIQSRSVERGRRRESVKEDEVAVSGRSHRHKMLLSGKGEG